MYITVQVYCNIVFHQADAKGAIVGDVLFQGSIGRTDLPRKYSEPYNSIEINFGS